MKRAWMWTLTIAVALAWSASAKEMNPMQFFGGGPKPYLEPDGYYRVVLPSGFDCEQTKPGHLECAGNRGHRALLSIDVKSVPQSATADLFALNQMERFKKKEHFKDLGRERVTLNGVEGVAATFSYDYYGNVQIPVGVKALYLVQNGKLIVVHFESRLEFFGRYVKDLKTFFETFRPTRLDAGGNPILSDLENSKPREKSLIRLPKNY